MGKRVTRHDYHGRPWGVLGLFLKGSWLGRLLARLAGPRRRVADVAAEAIREQERREGKGDGR